MSLIKSMPFHNLELSKAVTECRQRSFGLLILFVLLGVAGCSGAEATEDTLVDRSFLTGEPCAPPCWYGLELDKSSKADVFATLKGLPFIDPVAIREAGTVWLDDDVAQEIIYGCLQPKDAQCGGVLVSKDKVKLMWMFVGHELTFETVVYQLGPPNSLDYGVFNHDGGCRISLNWPEQNISIDSVNKESYAPCQAIKNGEGVSANAKVRLIAYLVKEGFPKPVGCCNGIAWPGFVEP